MQHPRPGASGYVHVVRMITADQIDYQNPPDADHLWSETFVFPVVVPEAHIYALVYVCVRPGIGVMANQVLIHGTLSDSRSDLLHYSENPHLPAPETLTHWTSPLGLSVRCTDPPRAFRIDYEGIDDTRIHVDWTGLMDPFDTHDPDHSPQAGAVQDMHSTGIGHGGRAGHFDMTGRITGTLTVRGQEFVVDAVERMDHSWGPRDPMALRSMYIVSATFGEDLAFHMICPWNPELTGPDAFALTHGYVLRDGEVFGLTSEATISSDHRDLMCLGLEMTVTDTRGRHYDLVATPDVGGPWTPYPSAIGFNSMMRWRCADRRGYGVVMPNYSLPALNRRCGRFHADQVPSPRI